MKNNGRLPLLFVLFLLSIGFVSNAQTKGKNIDAKPNIDSILVKARSLLYATPDIAFGMSQEAIALSKRYSNSLMLANSYRLQGSYYTDIKADFVQAEHCYRRADSIYRSNKGVEFKEGVGAIYHCYGVISQRKGDYFEAIQNYSMALAILDSLNNRTILPKTLNNISTLYSFLKEFSKAEQYARECLMISEQNNDQHLISVSSITLAAALVSQGKYSEVPLFISKAQSIATLRNDLYILGLCHLNLGAYYTFYKRDYAKSIEELLLAKKYTELLGNPWEQVRVLANLSESYFLNNQFEYAQKTAQETLDQSRQLGAVDIEQRILGLLARVEENSKNYQKAYRYLSQSTVLKDTVYNQSSQRQIHYFESLYQAEKKEKVIYQLQNQQKSTELILKRRSLTVIILLAIVVLVIVLSVLVYVKIKDKQIIGKQQIKLQEQQIKRLEQEKQIVATHALLEGETAERARLSKDLHDGIGGLLSLTKHKIANMKGNLTIPEEHVGSFNSAIEMLNSSIKELRRVAHNLMPESLMRYGLNSAIKDFCGNVDKTQYHFYGSDKRVDDKLEMASFRIVSELVNNALKHANANNINVQLVQEEDRISITVQDDGCGFDPKTIDPGKSGGYHNVESRVVSFGGRLDILSSPEKGTEVTVEFKP